MKLKIQVIHNQNNIIISKEKFKTISLISWFFFFFLLIIIFFYEYVWGLDFNLQYIRRYKWLDLLLEIEAIRPKLLFFIFLKSISDVRRYYKFYNKNYIIVVYRLFTESVGPKDLTTPAHFISSPGPTPRKKKCPRTNKEGPSC